MKSNPKESIAQLWILGFIAIMIALTVVFVGSIIYDYSWFSSISESATTNNTTSMILPFLLGMMALYTFTYKGYDKWDTLCTRLMAIGFTIVAMQPCISEFNNILPQIGISGVKPAISNLIHSIGAIVGFGSMIAWVGLCFTKSNDKITPNKRKRNKIYKTSAIIALLGILLFVLGPIFKINNYVWLAEFIILVPIGFSILVKAGLMFKDEVNRFTGKVIYETKAKIFSK